MVIRCSTCSSRLSINTEDELENVALAEHERNEKNKELKIKRRDYTGYDDDEFAPGQAGMKRSLLSKYDEFLEGPKENVSSELRIRVLIVCSFTSSGLPSGQLFYCQA